MLVKRNLQIVVCIFLRQNCRFTPAELWFNFTIPKHLIQNALWILKRNDKQLNGNFGCFRENQEGSFLFCKVLNTDTNNVCLLLYMFIIRSCKAHLNALNKLFCLQAVLFQTWSRQYKYKDTRVVQLCCPALVLTLSLQTQHWPGSFRRNIYGSKYFKMRNTAADVCCLMNVLQQICLFSFLTSEWMTRASIAVRLKQIVLHMLT